MKAVAVALPTGAFLALASPGSAQSASTLTYGADHYAAGQQVTLTARPARDVFAAGYDVNLNTSVARSAHLARFNSIDGAAVTGAAPLPAA